MNNKTLIGISVVVAIILAATIAYITLHPSANNKQTSTAITYTDAGFEPLSVTAKKSTPITVINHSSKDLLFASADHPAHRENTELNLDTIKPGNSGTVVITKAGTWGYHDHNNAAHTGRIIITN